MRNGVYIESGPRDFEIVQQDADGYAVLTWSGYWVMEGEYESADVYVRLLLEDSGEEVYTYTKCEMYEHKWSVSLRVPVGGLYKLETGLCLNNSLAKSWNLIGEMRHFFGVGDVFVLAGQSNSAGYGLGIVQDAPVLGVHAFKYSCNWQVASHPLGDATDAKFTASLDGSNLGRSPYILFGKLLRQRLNYPIGLVPTARGGSPISTWCPEEDGCLYMNMREITGCLSNGYKAVIWYQGCTEANNKNSQGYGKRFAAMVERWRRDSGKPDLPFFTVQLNRYMRADDDELDYHWGMLREEQRLAASRIPNCFILPASDIPLSDPIHNSASGCMILAERLAHQVHHQLYQLGQPFTTATLSVAEAIDPKRIRLIFEGQISTLETYDVPAEKLDITVADQKGIIELESYVVMEKYLLLNLKREIFCECTVSCGNKANISKTVPVDKGTYMPILSFCNVPVDLSFQ